MELKKSLKLIKKATDDKLEKYVIDYILDDYSTDDEITNFFKDLNYGGCKGGMIGSLIYYADTHEFYCEYADEIDELLYNYKEEIGEEFTEFNGDIRNALAWFGFEITAFNLATKLNIEI